MTRCVREARGREHEKNKTVKIDRGYLGATCYLARQEETVQMFRQVLAQVGVHLKPTGNFAATNSALSKPMFDRLSSLPGQRHIERTAHDRGGNNGEEKTQHGA